MKLTVILMLLMSTSAAAQVESLEKQAVSIVQQVPVSNLDSDLPVFPFKLWFNRLVGPEAGVIWQLSECGEGGAPQNRAERDLIACVEANAVLPDGRQVIVAFTVGTFKTGISGEPALFSALVERNGRFQWVNRLRHLPELLSGHRLPPVRLPDVIARTLRISQWADAGAISIRTQPWLDELPVPSPPPDPGLIAANRSAFPVEKPGPPGPPRPQQVQEGVLQGRATVMVKPAYPVHAKSLNASGSVVVQVVVSEEGRVINARAVSGPLVLREPSVEAARKWMFNPTMFNSHPVQVESFLTFVFSMGSN